jgi:dicarboxylate/amino acid:cation (Na+ or H+) symporter, DAACS family
MKLHHWLLLSLILGATLGLALQPYSDLPQLLALRQGLLDPLGQVFLRLIFMVVVPMVFCGLFLGVFELSSHFGLGKVVGRTIGYTIITSTASVLLGVFLVRWIKPGEGLNLPSIDASATSGILERLKTQAASSKTLQQTLVDIIPANPLAAATRALEGEMLSLMFFALVFGIAAAKLPKAERPTALIEVFEEIYRVSMRIVSYVLYLAPFAVFALVFSNINRSGVGLLRALVSYVGVVVFALIIQQFGVYSLLLKFVARLSPYKFFKDSREILLYAFATSSSNATLPRTLDLAETKLKLHPEISRFVLTVGSTANQNGTALFEGVTVLFLAQVYGIDLSVGQQFLVVVMSILAGVGTAGVPGGSLPLIVILLQQVGIPVEGIGIVLGVDRFLDMCRTVVNVSGDLVIAAVVSRQADVGPAPLKAKRSSTRTR